MPGEEDRLTVHEVATALGITDEAVRNWIRTGKLRGRWLLGSRRFGYRVERRDLVEFLRRVGEEGLAADVESGKLPAIVRAS